jgi:hypothetical protein
MRIIIKGSSGSVVVVAVRIIVIFDHLSGPGTAGLGLGIIRLVGPTTAAER